MVQMQEWAVATDAKGTWCLGQDARPKSTLVCLYGGTLEGNLSRVCMVSKGLQCVVRFAQGDCTGAWGHHQHISLSPVCPWWSLSGAAEGCILLSTACLHWCLGNCMACPKMRWGLCASLSVLYECTYASCLFIWGIVNVQKCTVKSADRGQRPPTVQKNGPPLEMQMTLQIWPASLGLKVSGLPPNSPAYSKGPEAPNVDQLGAGGLWWELGGFAASAAVS
jgi:hypothetical protein